MVKAAGKHYAQCIRAETLRVGASVTADDLIEAMSETYRIAGGCDKDNSDKDTGVHGNETALVTGSFQYNCYNCGKNGHKAQDCQEKKKERTQGMPGKFCGICDDCGGYGHRNKRLLGRCRECP